MKQKRAARTITTVKEIKIAGLPADDRIWRIDWFDKVLRNPSVESDPLIKVLISPPYEEDKWPKSTEPPSIFDDYKRDWKHSKVVELPISYLNRISIGSMWRNGKLVDSPKRKSDKVHLYKIDIQPQCAEPVFTTVSEESIGKWNYQQFSNSNCIIMENCKASNMNQRGILKRIVIPCSELLRFYFATSTKLVRKIIYHSDDRLWNELILIEDSEGNIRTKPIGTELLLTLKTLIPNSDCWSIARLWTDETARREVNRLYRSLASSSLMMKKATQIKMGFPFSSSSRLDVYGKMSVDGKTLLVLNIESCDADFNFTRLNLDRENSNLVKNKYGYAKEVGFSHKSTSNLNDSDNITLSNHNEPTKYVNRRVVKDIKEKPRFSKTKNIDLKRVVKENRKYRNVPGQEVSSSQAQTYGTGDGSYTGNDDHFPIDIVEEHEVAENLEITGAKTPSGGNRNDARPYFVELIQIMHEFQKQLNAIEFDWNVINLPRCIRQKGLILSTFPDPNPEYGDGSGWLNISKSQRRRLLWLEIRKKHKFFYIVELDCKPTEHKGIYILKYKDGLQASNEEIRKVMQLWASSDDYCTKDGLRSAGKLPWDRKTLRHKEPERLYEEIRDYR